MSLVSSTIPNLIAGVSQQPPSLRDPSQAEVAENVYPSPVEGLIKRPPIRHRKKIANAPYGDAYVHTINRDLVERYVVVIINGDLKVFDMNGTEKTVNFPNGKAYLNAATPSSMFSAVTVADYTFIVNKTVTVATDAVNKSPQQPKHALIWIKSSDFGVKYDVTVTTQAVTTDASAQKSATFTVSDGQNIAASAESKRTDFISTQLYNSLATNSSIHGPTGWQQMGSVAQGLFKTVVARRGSFIYLQSIDNTGATDFQVNLGDSFGEQATFLIKDRVQRLSDLPSRAWNGTTVLIDGEQGTEQDNYYVKFVTDVNSSNTTNGTWQETLKANEEIAFDKATMPFVLIRESNGTFTFRQGDWEPRTVGDLNSNPFPSFVGSKISDIFFHRNRLGVIADESLVYSRDGEYFNFFRETCSQVLDTDPIDVTASHTKVSILRYAVPWNEDLLLFADQTQFVQGTTGALTGKNTTITVSTEYEIDAGVKPVAAGSAVYFASKRGEWTGIREYVVDLSSETNIATDVTAQTPAYVPKGIKRLIASTNEDILIGLSGTKPNELYVYKYYISGNEKLQSAWTKWVMPAGDTILNVDFLDTDLYLVVNRSDGAYLEVASLAARTVDTGLTYTFYLDRRIDETQVTGLSYNAGLNQTTFTLPYTPINGETYELYAGVGNASIKTGQKLTYSRSGAVVTVSGNLTKFFFGRAYTARFQFSTLYLRQPGQSGDVAVTDGRLALKGMTLTLGDSGFLKAIVTPKGRDASTYVYNGKPLGSQIIGEQSVQPGTLQFPIGCRNDYATIVLENASPFPSAVLSATWEGYYTNRSRRL